MKLIHYYILLTCIFSFASPLFSQQCTNDSLTLLQSGSVSYTGSGFIDPNMLPCVSSGNYSEIVIPFNTYNQGARLLTRADSTTVPVSHIYSIQVNSISGLPSGLCWFMLPSSQAITGTQTGSLIIKGATSVSAGTYPLSVNISIDTQGSGSYNYTSLTSFNYKTLLGQVILKVMGSDNNCPTITY